MLGPKKLMVRGASVEAARRFAQTYRSTEAFPRFVESLSPEEEALFIGQINRKPWYDVESYANMLSKAAEFLAPDAPDKFLEDGGRFVVEDGVTTIYKAFFAVASPAFVLRGSAMLWRTFFKGSQLKVTASGRGYAQAEIRGASYCSKAMCASIRGGMLCSLEHGGARSLEVKEHHCRSEGGDVCRFHFTWTQ